MLGGFTASDPDFDLLTYYSGINSEDGFVSGPRVANLDASDVKDLLDAFPLNLKGEVPISSEIKARLKSLKGPTDDDESADRKCKLHAINKAAEQIANWYRHRCQLLLNVKTVRFLIEECGWTSLKQKNKLNTAAAVSDAIEIVAKRLNIENNYKANVRKYSFAQATTHALYLPSPHIDITVINALLKPIMFRRQR